VGEIEVVVGDRAETDGTLAHRLGARFALVLSGVTSARTFASSVFCSTRSLVHVFQFPAISITIPPAISRMITGTTSCFKRCIQR